MLDIKQLEIDENKVKENLSKRNFDLSLVDKVIELNSLRKKLTQEVESNRSEIKKLSKEIGAAKSKGEDAQENMNKVANLKTSISEKESELKHTQEELEFNLMAIPNLLVSEVPLGNSEENNQEIRRWGTPRKFSFTPKDHHELGESLGMLDFQSAAKITGSRFVVYRKEFARLERALANFMLDFHIERGYEEIIPPYIVHENSLIGTGQLPKFKEDLFKLENTSWYLIPTSEVPLTNIRREELFLQNELPLRFCALTPCFRSEAGSYGKDTRGLIRQHQFNKVEMVQIVAQSESQAAHESMIKSASELLEKLGLPYRAMLLCSGDIGFSAQKCVDLEVWLPAQNTYREISSISNCGDFQARRAQIRYRNQEGKPEFAHTLNGSGLAVGRTLVAIIENYQNEDGSITIPEILVPYMGGMTKISKK